MIIILIEISKSFNPSYDGGILPRFSLIFTNFHQLVKISEN
jgi:hypothetical protein